MQRVFVAVAAAVTAVVVLAAPAAPQSCAGVIGHRGAPAVKPENTMPSVRTAMSLGARRVEVDVRRTGDGRWILMHDDTLSRTTDVENYVPGGSPWPVAGTAYSTVRLLDAGSWRTGTYAAVPTLRDTVALNVPLLLDLKVK